MGSELIDNFNHICDRSHNQKSQGMQEHLKRDHIAGMISEVVFNVYMNELWGQLLCLMMLSL